MFKEQSKYEFRRIKEALGKNNTAGINSIMVLKDKESIKEIWEDLKTKQVPIKPERWNKITEREEMEEKSSNGINITSTRQHTALFETKNGTKYFYPSINHAKSY